jgi:tetratricopeptide (TPR) repeat protein
MSEQPAAAVPAVYDLYREGCRLLADGNPADAIAPLEQAVEREPDSASLREALARACFATSRIRRARSEFERALVLDPSNAYAHYGLGRALERQGRLILAAKHFKLANALTPRPAYARAAERIARRTAG